MGHLPRHLEAVRSWIDQVEDVVVVDSFSEDGTPEHIRASLPHPKLRILSHPPGLFQSWNHGVHALKSRFAYIATVGDVITPDGLGRLVDSAERFQSDVVLSKPLFRDESGRVLEKKKWSIHKYLQCRNLREPAVLPSSHLFLTSAFEGMAGMMGSSASNLYRTGFLQAHPFPTDFGPVGDTAWGVANAFLARAAVTPETCAEFLIHPNSNYTARWRKTPGAAAPAAPLEKPSDPNPVATKEREMDAKLLAFARETLHKGLEDGTIPHAAEAFTEVLQEFERLRNLLRLPRNQLERYKKSAVPWVINPRAWMLRQRRNKHRRAIDTLWRRCLARYSF